MEFARHVCLIKNAVSGEFESSTGQNGVSARKVIDYMEGQSDGQDKGASMRLGAYACRTKENSLARRLYQKECVYERHRHRFEFNNQFKALFEEKGMVFSGLNKEKGLVEIIELPQHAWFLAVQFHPEFRSKPLSPHPLFASFISSALKKRSQNQNTVSQTSV